MGQETKGNKSSRLKRIHPEAKYISYIDQTKLFQCKPW